MTLQLVGLSHQVAPVELRERVALDLDAAAELARSLGDAVCLSTCNRTEIYSIGVPEAAAVSALESLAGHRLGGVLYTRLDDEAALHLFRVAAGLDSLVPGEGEILGQVRAAFAATEPPDTPDARKPPAANLRQPPLYATRPTTFAAPSSPAGVWVAGMRI